MAGLLGVGLNKLATDRRQVVPDGSSESYSTSSDDSGDEREKRKRAEQKKKGKGGLSRADKQQMAKMGTFQFPDGGMDPGHLFHFLSLEFVTWISKTGLLIHFSGPSIWPDAYYSIHWRTAFVATLGIDFVSFDFPHSDMFILFAIMSVFLAFFVKGVLSHMMYSAFIPTDQTALWIHDSDENPQKSEDPVKWTDRLSYYLFKYWFRMNHQDRIWCRQYWEFHYIHRFWPFWLSKRHRDFCREEDTTALIDGTFYKGHMVEKRQIVWAYVRVLRKGRSGRVARLNTQEDDDEGPGLDFEDFPDNISETSKTSKSSKDRYLDMQKNSLHNTFGHSDARGASTASHHTVKSAAKEAVKPGTRGWFLCQTTMQMGLARSRLYTVPFTNVQNRDEGGQTFHVLDNAMELFEEPDAEDSEQLGVVQPGQRVCFLDYKEELREFADQTAAGELLGPGKGDIGMVIDVGMANRATGTRQIVIRNMRTGECGHVDTHDLQPCRMYGLAHLDKQYFKHFSMRMGTFFRYFLKNWIFIPGFLMMCSLYCQYMGWEDGAWTNVEIPEEDKKWYRMWARVYFGAAFVWTGLIFFDTLKIFLLRNSWYGMHTVDNTYTETYQRKLAECNWDQGATGMRPQRQATYDFWTVVPMIEVGGTLLLMQSLQIPSVQRSLRIMVEREEDPDSGEVTNVEWVQDQNEIILGLTAAGFCTFGLLWYFYLLKHTHETEYGEKGPTEYAVHLHETFKSRIKSYYRELTVVETTIFTACVIFFAGEAQVSLCLLVTLCGFLFVTCVAIYADPRANRALMFGKGTLVLMQLSALMNIKFIDNKEDPDMATLVLVTELIAFSASILFIGHIIYSMDIRQQWRSLMRKMKQMRPRLQVARFTESRAPNFKGISKWSEEHLKNLSVDQRGWLLKYHLSKLKTKWRVLDFGAGAHGEQLANIRGQSAEAEFVRCTKDEPGLKSLRCVDTPSLTEMPTALEECEHLEELNLSQCAEMTGAIVDFGKMPNLKKVQLEETRVHDPLGFGDKVLCTTTVDGDPFIPLWTKEPPTLQQVEQHADYDMKFTHNGVKVYVSYIMDAGEGVLVGLIEMKDPNTLREDQGRFPPAWCECRFLELRKEQTRQATDRERHTKLGVQEQRHADVHLVPEIVQKRWPHLQEFKWTYGDSSLLAQRIELMHRMGDMFGNAQQ